MSDVEVVLRDLNRLSLFCRIVVLMRRCYFRENWEKTPHATPKCVTRPRVLRCEREAFSATSSSGLTSASRWRMH
jgi:hypothetical protein